MLIKIRQWTQNNSALIGQGEINQLTSANRPTFDGLSQLLVRQRPANHYMLLKETLFSSLFLHRPISEEHIKMPQAENICSHMTSLGSRQLPPWQLARLGYMISNVTCIMLSQLAHVSHSYQAHLPSQLWLTDIHRNTLANLNTKCYVIAKTFPYCQQGLTLKSFPLRSTPLIKGRTPVAAITNSG